MNRGDRLETQIFKTLNIDGTDQRVIATSYSQIDTYLSCPFRWKLDYLLGQREPATSEALSLGTSIHETLEQYFNGVREGKTWELGEAQDMLEFNMDMNDIPFANEESKALAEKQHHDMIEGLVNGTSNLASFMEDKEVVACEKAFNLCIILPFTIMFDGNSYDRIYIIGSIDFIVKDKDGGLHVIDFKSGKNPFPLKKLKENLQLKIYSLVVKEIYGRLPVSTQYYFTRLDVFQNVLPLGETDSDRYKEYYKNGKVKEEGNTVSEVYDKLIDIFREQYTVGKYKPAPCPLCSWCSHGLYEKNNCRYAMKYIRKDIPLPKRTKNIIKA